MVSLSRTKGWIYADLANAGSSSTPRISTENIGFADATSSESANKKPFASYVFLVMHDPRSLLAYDLPPQALQTYLPLSFAIFLA